jgi:hypothetical protein
MTTNNIQFILLYQSATVVVKTHLKFHEPGIAET